VVLLYNSIFGLQKEYSLSDMCHFIDRGHFGKKYAFECYKAS